MFKARLNHIYLTFSAFDIFIVQIIVATIIPINHSRLCDLSDDKKRYSSRGPVDGEKTVTLETIESEMIKAGGLPFDYCFDIEKLTKAICILTQNDAVVLDEEDRERYKPNFETAHFGFRKSEPIPFAEIANRLKFLTVPSIISFM